MAQCSVRQPPALVSLRDSARSAWGENRLGEGARSPKAARHGPLASLQLSFRRGGVQYGVGCAERRTQGQTLETSLSWSRCSICLHLQKGFFGGVGEANVLSLYTKRTGCKADAPHIRGIKIEQGVITGRTCKMIPGGGW